MITYEKHLRLKDGSFTITLRADSDLDEIALIRLRGKALQLVPEPESQQEVKQDIMAGLLLLRDMVDDLIDARKKEAVREVENESA